MQTIKKLTGAKVNKLMEPMGNKSNKQLIHPIVWLNYQQSIKNFLIHHEKMFQAD